MFVGVSCVRGVRDVRAVCDACDVWVWTLGPAFGLRGPGRPGPRAVGWAAPAAWASLGLGLGWLWLGSGGCSLGLGKRRILWTTQGPRRGAVVLPGLGLGLGGSACLSLSTGAE